MATPITERIAPDTIRRLILSRLRKKICEITRVTNGAAKVIGVTTVTGARPNAEKKQMAPAPAQTPASTDKRMWLRRDGAKLAITGRWAVAAIRSVPISRLKVTVTSAGEYSELMCFTTTATAPNPAEAPRASRYPKYFDGALGPSVLLRVPPVTTSMLPPTTMMAPRYSSMLGRSPNKPIARIAENTGAAEPRGAALVAPIIEIAVKFNVLAMG